MTKHWFHAYLTKKFTQGKMLGLDVGCGRGNWDEFKQCKFIGIDKIGNPDIIHDLNNDLPFDDKVFDVAICYSVLEYVGNDAKLLKEIHRVLKPNAIFVCITQNKLIPQKQLRKMLTFVGFSSLYYKNLKEWIWATWYNLTSVYVYTINQKRTKP